MKTVTCPNQPWPARKVAERPGCIKLRRVGTLFLLCLLGAVLGSAGCKPARVPPPKGTTPKPAATGPGQTNTTGVGTNPLPLVFTDDPKTSHDPFFPNSTRRGTPAVANTNTNTNPATRPVVASRPSVLALKGIMGPASRRVALINDQELVEGDTAVFILGGSEVRVRCLQIRSNAVEVAVGETGERKVLPLN